jgi:hypothetical protein
MRVVLFETKNLRRGKLWMKTRWLTSPMHYQHVVYAYPNAGYSSDQEKAREHLTLGDVYDVERVDVRDWSTSIYLKDFPGIAFNSVLFSSLD